MDEKGNQVTHYGEDKRRFSVMGVKTYASLVLITVIVLLTVFFIKQKSGDRTEMVDTASEITSESEADMSWKGGVIELYGMEMRWEPAGRLAHGSFGTEIDVKNGNEYCIFVFSEEDLDTESGLKPQGVAYHPGYCLQELGFTSPEGERRSYSDESSFEFGLRYAKAYTEKCGNVFEPLGWGNIFDGVCELPNPVDVAEEFYSWKNK